MIAKAKKEKKIFVLDTSVILYDHNAVKSFQEHDVAIPITVLEELDNFKKGNDTKNFEAREFIRFLDDLSGESGLQEWIPLNGHNKGNFKVIMTTHGTREVDAEEIFDERKADHKILNAALNVQEENKDAKVILVTKDINLRLKAKSLNLPAEDYSTGKVKDVESLYNGKTYVDNIPSEVINQIYDQGYCSADVIPKDLLGINHYFIIKSQKNSVLAFHNAAENRIEHVEKKMIYGIKPRNAEQTFAIHAILNPNIKLVSIQGVAGTGKTLLALAGTLEQRKLFKQIYLARPIVPLSNKDIGYLPGDIKSKLNPYMEPLFDNLKFIQNQFAET
ncbi:MAG TPA: PIN domain-containing protein, partial [Cytophagaceae bacterium]